MEGDIITTIAWDGKYLACDSRVTCESRIVTDKGRKMYILSESSAQYRGDKLLAIGFSGCLVDFDRIIDAIMDQTIGTNIAIPHDSSGIAVGEKYIYRLESESEYLIRYDRDIQLACGSGSPYAMTAMYLGKSAKQAVKIAMALDCATGGEIHAIKLEE